MNLLGIFHSHSDPSAALLVDDEVVAFGEEERLTRIKHDHGAFPIRAIRWVLEYGSLELSDIDYVVQAWDCAKYDDGRMARRYEEINDCYTTIDEDRAYQRRLLNQMRSSTQKSIIERALRREFGDIRLPPIRFVNHHFAHACQAFYTSGFDDALVATIDGSGEDVTTAWWHGRGENLELLHEIRIPHSLGWFYSAFTEYLGFDAYDGEYKVMGLAAYGKANPILERKVAELIWPDAKGGFETDPSLLSRGKRSFSYYYPDSLTAHLGRPPRSRVEPVDGYHKNLAFVVQSRLEEVVTAMARHWVLQTKAPKLCISGGVGMNVKMNGNLFHSNIFDDVFVYPLCGDLGQSIGATLALRHELTGLKSARLGDLYLGPGYSDSRIEELLAGCKVNYRVSKDITRDTAALLAQGKVVGWFQGRMEAGPRALGARSILADPRSEAARDNVNAAIKYRELWRPFCPSMTEAGAKRYFHEYTYAPFMIVTFRANDRARREIPAVVHIDGTSRPQIIDEQSNPRYFSLISEFDRLTGIPCLLNTSFNIKGEPIVCTPQDALRTYFATGLDALAIGSCLLEKTPC